MAQKYSIQLLAATTAQWNESKYVIPEGELVAELLTDGKIQLKIGNGLNKFSDLSYVADRGVKGDTGDPGFSPTVEVAKEGTIATVTITDSSGDKVFTVNDGVSPTVSTSKTDNIATVTITDGNGNHTFEVKDGDKGDKGDAFTFADLTDAQKLELKGDTGEGFVVQGTYDTVELLEANVTSPSIGIAYGIGSAAPYDIYIYDGVQSAWVNHGQLQGAKGDKGDAFTYEDFTSEQLAALEGEDGVSPTVSLSKVDNVATITVIDANGTQTIDILDGADAEVTIDVEVSDTSENPVQNKVIKAYIDGLIGDVDAAVEEINGILGGATT